MSAGHDRKSRMLEWMAYADGELDPEHAEAIEQELAKDPEAVATIEAFRSMGDRLRRDHAVVAPDLTDAIMAKVSAERVPLDLQAPAHNAQVLDLAAARARRFKVGAALASITAAAAAVALWIGGRSLPEGAPEFAASALGVEVQHVESGEAVTVFSIPALHSNASSVVVWLGDDHQDEASTEPAPSPTPSDAQGSP